jgi:hypothetical protein
VAKQNNELLMKNHKFRPTGSTPFPKANGTSFHGNKRNGGRGGELVEKIIYVKGNILIILTKKMLLTTRSRTTLRRNKMKTKVYRINL